MMNCWQMAEECGISNHIIQSLSKFSEGHYTPSVVQCLKDTKFSFNNRATRRLGQWSADKGIEIHQVLKNHKEDFRQTFIHEIAHLTEYSIFKTSGHGTRWQSIMRLYDASPDTIATNHSEAMQKDIDTFTVRKANHIYTCMDCAKQIPKIRILKRVYRHIECVSKPNRGLLVKTA